MNPETRVEEKRGERVEVGRGRGLRITRRDRELLAMMAMARYLSSEQIQRLFFSGRTEAACRIRLFQLAGLGKQPQPTPYICLQKIGSEVVECTEWAEAASRDLRAETTECGTRPPFALKKTAVGFARTTDTEPSPSSPAAPGPCALFEALCRARLQPVRPL